MSHKNLENLQRLIEVVEKLRAPDGCPWDKEQTHETLRENFIQETYEAVDAIESGNCEDLKEELGDVLLQVVLHSQIASEESRFDIEDVAKTIADKIIRRHPHVFAETKVKGTEEVLVNWERIKSEEKPERTSALSGVVKSQPALMSATQISKKAIKVGFEWPNVESLWECLESEIQEFKQAVEEEDKEKMEDELGDILFSLVNVARWHGVDAELALLRANKKFTKRFQLMEEIATKDLTEYTQAELEDLWQNAKKALQQ
ncbi:MAG: nucleoside triphosphate pyrophosphohydrolase [Candidatus Melainabacteria bacterium RIFOXYA12_FULL_32_12]|nr:MAG: nucleoside triphosphate pyrophosphohydrolase [Candidatus Melainabacteria bacterium RIFOXYA2_FULL_32_9]OGI30711.1 MAG: nucleoside triphosphate pyrophosphohydrolase [Candidatus Melainabacteria bacterium RIFOXYA12_FULL_32_12]